MKMTMTYDAEAGAAYVYAPGRESEPGIVDKTVEHEVRDEYGDLISSIYVDYDKAGKVFGVDILGPHHVTICDIVKYFEE